MKRTEVSSPKPVHSTVRGSVRVPADKVRAKLGGTAYAVWQAFLGARDWQGYSAQTARRVAASVALGTVKNRDKAVARALRRLAEAKLVRYAGRRTFVRGSSEVRVHIREVRGDLFAGEAALPFDAWRAIMDMNEHGGKRVGAGRKAGIKTGVPQIKKGGGTQIKKGGQVGNTASDSNVPVPSEQEGGASAAPSFVEAGAGAKVLLFPTPAQPVVTVFDARLTDPEVPEFPGMDLLEPAVVPSPPKLNPDDPDGSWALALVRAYRGAVQSRYNVKSGAFRQNNVATSKYAKALAEAARKLIEYDIPPASWAAFSLDVWRKYSGEKASAKKPPALQWVFAAKRIEERHGWYKRESSSYTGGRVLFSKSAKELMTRYQSMRLELLHSEDSPGAVVARHFPDGCYERLLRTAREEAQAERRSLSAALARGEWLWR